MASASIYPSISIVTLWTFLSPPFRTQRLIVWAGKRLSKERLLLKTAELGLEQILEALKQCHFCVHPGHCIRFDFERYNRETRLDKSHVFQAWENWEEDRRRPCYSRTWKNSQICKYWLQHRPKIWQSKNRRIAASSMRFSGMRIKSCLFKHPFTNSPNREVNQRQDECIWNWIIIA